MSLDEADAMQVLREKKLHVVGVIAEEGMAGLLMAAIRPDR